jgi:hypothetical protein
VGHGGRELRALRALQREVWGDTCYDACYDHRPPASRALLRNRSLGAATIALGALLVVFGIAPAGAHGNRIIVQGGEGPPPSTSTTTTTTCPHSQ